MFIIDKKNYQSVFEVYKKQSSAFPLITAVIKGVQSGTVWANDVENPTHFFVTNKFGFAFEFFSEFDEKFSSSLMCYIQKQEYQRIRWYNPPSITLEKLKLLNIGGGYNRTQWIFSGDVPELVLPQNYTIVPIDKNILPKIDFGLDLQNRFWDSADDFLNHAIGFVAIASSFNGDIKNEVSENNIAGVCYSACVADRKAEIDIAVDERHRKNGIGKAMAIKFIEECISQKIEPCWDCYSNNAGSMGLAKSLGFKEKHEYVFYIVQGK